MLVKLLSPKPLGQRHGNCTRGDLQPLRQRHGNCTRSNLQLVGQRHGKCTRGDLQLVYRMNVTADDYLKREQEAAFSKRL